jgi:crotonobetainyl-CoA:carnitine CoA-transferase CaiB-like acyl-CoA transferase
VKIEPPGRGDSDRASMPSVLTSDASSMGATFLRNNLGKRSVTVI